jgi:hypothetical protein
VLFPSGFITNILHAFFFAPIMLHALPITSSLTVSSFIQRIRPSPRPFVTFRNKLIFLRWWVVSPMLNPQVGRPPFVGCPRLLMQDIRNYASYLEAISSTRSSSVLFLNLSTHVLFLRDCVEYVVRLVPSSQHGKKMSIAVSFWKP